MTLREANSALHWAATRPEDNTPTPAVAVGHFVQVGLQPLTCRTPCSAALARLRSGQSAGEIPMAPVIGRRWKPVLRFQGEIPAIPRGIFAFPVQHHGRTVGGGLPRDPGGCRWPSRQGSLASQEASAS